MTFFPDVNFLEFIPEKDSVKSIKDKSYVPRTLLINEIKPNERYEIVITKFRGGAFVRYRVGDVIECLALKNEAYKIYLPQIRFVDRISNVIDLAGFTRITKTTIQKALEISGLPINEWIASKQYEDKEPVLHIYMEMNDELNTHSSVKSIVHDNLQIVDSDYKDIESMLGRDPLRITLLPAGAFQKHTKLSGEALIKMNPSRKSIDELIKCS